MDVPSGAYDPANVGITGGTIDGTVIGGTTPAAAEFTTIGATGLVQLSTTANFRPLAGGSWRVFQDFHFLNGQVLNFELETSTGQGIFAAGRGGVGASFCIGIGSLDSASAPDVLMFRDDANIWALRNSTTAQIMRVYNTFTDASNYERGCMQWSGNVLGVGAQAAGSGTLRALNLLGSALQINGTAGASAGPFTSITSITVTNGIVTAITGT